MSDRGMLAEQNSWDRRGHGYQLHVGPMRPTSRGEVNIRSTNPYEHPMIDARVLSTDHDWEEMRESVRAARKMSVLLLVHFACCESWKMFVLLPLYYVCCGSWGVAC